MRLDPQSTNRRIRGFLSTPLLVILSAHTEMEKKPPEPESALKRCGRIPQAYHRVATGSDRACSSSHARMVRVLVYG